MDSSDCSNDSSELTKTREATPEALALKGRSAARLMAVQMICMAEEQGGKLGDEATQQVLSAQITEEGGNPDLTYLKVLLAPFVDDLSFLDSLIFPFMRDATTWGAMQPLLKAILRAGTADMKQNPDLSPALLINEYVRLAHGFLSGQEPRFVHGVLDKVGKELQKSLFSENTT